MDYKIVSIALDHLEGFRAAVDAVAKERKYLSFFECPPFEMSLDFVKENIKEDLPHFVAICNNEVVGWCDISSLTTSLNRLVYSHCGEVGIGVIAEYRGQGIGEALMRAALQKAKSKGFLRIELNVFSENKPAIELYNKIGFVVEGKKRNAVLIDGKYDDLICMGLLFSQV